MLNIYRSISSLSTSVTRQASKLGMFCIIVTRKVSCSLTGITSETHNQTLVCLEQEFFLNNSCFNTSMRFTLLLVIPREYWSCLLPLQVIVTVCVSENQKYFFCGNQHNAIDRAVVLNPEHSCVPVSNVK